MLRIKIITNRIFSSKTYILYQERCEKVWLVDIGDVESVFEFLDGNHLIVEGVVLTHAHFDHIYGLPELINHYPKCMVYAAKYAKLALASDKMNLSRYHGTPIRYKGNNVIVVHEGDNISLFEGEPPLQFYETPGHSPDSLTMILGDWIFTGDAYIPGIKVVTTLPNGDKVQAEESRHRIIRFSENKTIFSGH